MSLQFPSRSSADAADDELIDDRALESVDAGRPDDGDWRCGNSGARFELESALLTLADAERFGRRP